MNLIHSLFIALSIIDLLHGEEEQSDAKPQIQLELNSADTIPTCPEPDNISQSGRLKDINRRVKKICTVRIKGRGIPKFRGVNNELNFCNCKNDGGLRGDPGLLSARHDDKEKLIKKDNKGNISKGCTVLRRRRSGASSNLLRTFRNVTCCQCSYEPIPPWMPPSVTLEPKYPFPIFPRLPTVPPIPFIEIGRRKRSVKS